MNQAVVNGLIIGIIEGLLLGLIPLITGMKKNQLGLAMGGFFGCIIAGAVGGLIMGIPCSALFWWLVKKSENKSKDFKD
jgi:hypothetical protein